MLDKVLDSLKKYRAKPLRFGSVSMVAGVGLEPTTFGL